MARYRISPSVIASYFKHRCDRLFRFTTVPSAVWGKAGTIGWRVPKKLRQNTRPGVAQLMKGGNEFEVAQLRALEAEYGILSVHHEGVDLLTNKVNVLSFASFLEAIDKGSPARFFAQIELDFDSEFGPEVQEKFLQQFGLDTNLIQLTRALPDLLEVVPPDSEGGPTRLRIWDFKASRKPRHEHYIQVAFYSLLLEHVLQLAGRHDILVDTEFAVIKSRQVADTFVLAPYRTAIRNFLRDTAQTLLNTPAQDAHYHYCESCMLCEYADTCRNEADAYNDLSRVPYMSSTSKRRLRRAGIPTHRELAALDGDLPRLAALRLESHDLSSNLHRYVKAAQTLEDGLIRSLETKNLLMPRYEDVRVVLSAEQDSVSATCFALGLKTYEGWNTEENTAYGIEAVFISDGPQHEGVMLLNFLKLFNDLLVRIDAENKAVETQPIPADQQVIDAEIALTDAEQALADFKVKHPRLLSKRADHLPLIEEREGLKQAVKDAEAAVKEAKSEAKSQRWKLLKRLHIYIYDSLDLMILKECLERHLLSDKPVGLLDEVRRLIRLFPPESVLPDSTTFRTVPGTVVSQVLRQSLTLPAAYGFDLASVSVDLQPTKADGEEKGYEYRPKYGFGWAFSNQVAFERIHDVWNNSVFSHPGGNMDTLAIREWIEKTVLNKLRATNTVIRAIKQRLGSDLLLKKEAFRLAETFDASGPVVTDDAHRVLDVMEVFTVLEESFSELKLKHGHTLPVAERVAKFECINGLRYAGTANNLLQFTFDPNCRDTKISVGEFNLVLTSESNPDELIVDVDGKLFHPVGWRGAKNKVTLMVIEHQASPPTLQLYSQHIDHLQRMFAENPDNTYALDPMYADHNSKRVLATVKHLKIEPEAEHVRQLVAEGTIDQWSPFVANPIGVEAALVQLAGNTWTQLMNPAQWGAVAGVLREPVSLIWGPPGTGKTYTVAHMLLCYALAAKRQERPLRLLVTAFTHHAIVNVLTKTIELANRYGIGNDILSVFKVKASGENSADNELPANSLIEDKEILMQLATETPCVLIGSTVWGVYKAMKKHGIPQGWFDVVLIDESSQMKLPDALLAMAASKSTSSLILAGDDKQLPPILHGTYAEEHKPVLSSVFVFMRHRFDQQLVKQNLPGTHRALFQLEENFRMNEPLTAYPRQVIYGNYVSTKPVIKINLDYTVEPPTTDPLLSLLMDPEKPVILVRYTPSVSYTARNPIEVTLISQAVSYLATRLIANDTGRLHTPETFAEKGVAVLAPHRAQNAAIRNTLAQAGFGTSTQPMPLVDTVEKLQGKERTVVLVSYGVADEEYAEAEAAFLLSENRFNVATTRAERKLIVFCADPVINVVPTDRQTLLDATMLKEFKNYCADGQQTHDVTLPQIGDVAFTVHWKGFN